MQAQKDAGKTIRASYHIEVIVRTRGAAWDLHRRTTSENSALFASYKDLFEDSNSPRKRPHLFSAYLSKKNWALINKDRPREAGLEDALSLGFSVELGVLVPEYEVDRILFSDDHYEGGYIFRDKINFEIFLREGVPNPVQVKYGFDSAAPNQANLVSAFNKENSKLEIEINRDTFPGIKAKLVLEFRAWE